MPERDANQLAADVRATLNECERVLTAVWWCGHRLPAELANDVDIDVEAATEKFEEIVALVGTLQQERDEALKNVDALAKLAESAQAAFLDIEERNDDLFTGLGRMEARAEAALAEKDAALTNMTAWHNEAQARVNELEAALADAHSDRLRLLDELNDVAGHLAAARRGLPLPQAVSLVRSQAEEQWRKRAEAAEAALAETEAARENWKGLAEDRGAALATTRQALTWIAQTSPDRTAARTALRALADTGGDTK